MPVQQLAPRCPARELVVMLPGALSTPDEFVTEGIVAALRDAAPACEVWLADAHLGYFVEELLLERLRADVLAPAHARGLRPWLLGVSLGGFAALACAMRHGEALAGVVALAPYLGRRELMRDISAAGGPALWRAADAAAGAGDAPSAAVEDALWRWLADPARRRGDGPPLYLGYGASDRFADAHRVLAALLPEGHSTQVAGGHDWPPWRVLWRRWLQRRLVGGAAASGGGCGA